MKEEMEYEVKKSKLDASKVQSKLDKLMKEANVDIKDKSLKDALKSE